MSELLTYEQSHCARGLDLPLRFDNTRLVDYDKCPRLFYLRHVLGWAVNNTAAPLAFGQGIHAALDAYYNTYFFTDLRPPYCRPSRADLVEAAWAAFRRTYEPLIPIEEQEEPRTTDRAFDILSEYADVYSREQFTVRLPSHIEVGFAAPLPGIEDVLIGRCDMIADHQNEGLSVIEHKTTWQMGSQFLNSFRPNNQITGYIYGASFVFPEVRSAIINGVQVAKTKTGFARVPTTRTEAELTDFANQTVWKIERIKADACWPMNTSSCTYYGRCPFHDLCFTGYPLSHWTDVAREGRVPHGYTVSFWEPWLAVEEAA